MLLNWVESVIIDSQTYPLLGKTREAPLSNNRKQRRAEKSLNRKRGSPQVIQEKYNEALRHHRAGRLAEAEPLYRQVLALEPSHADSLHLLGVLSSQTGHPEIAVKMISQAIALKEDDPFLYNNLGSAFKDMGRLNEAEASYRRALALDPRFVDALSNLGSVLRTRGRTDEAMDCYRRLLLVNPEHAGAHDNLGSLFRDQGRLDEAEAMFRRVCILDPGFVEAHVNLGVSLQEQDRFDDAVACYEHVLSLKPDDVEALNNLGNTFKAQGNLDEAIVCHNRVLAIKPESALHHSNLLLTMVYAASVSPQELAATAREFGKKIADPLRRKSPLIRDDDPERKLRVGYVSPDFHEHAVNYFFEPLLKLHDRRQFELFAYANVIREDAVTTRLKREFDHWRDIRPLNDDEAADLIEADAIDILVDLAGHTRENRLMVFARKPAPVQVTWLGYPATTGMDAVDYRITDGYAEPPGMTEHLNAETLWRLPEIFCCYAAHENSPAGIDHPPFEDNGYITFGCFNNFAKVTDPVLETWARIMAQVPESRLLLEITGIDSPQFRAATEARLLRSGLPLDRIILEPRKRSNQFVLYNRIDIALDPFPCTGGTTSMDTMWMGVPFVTMAGDHFVSRMGVTILTNAGMPELIARNVDEYVDLATNLALDRDRLRGLRHNLRDRVASSPLMNQKSFARNMEAAYREMWRKWCKLNGQSSGIR